MYLWKKYSMLNDFLDWNSENRSKLPYINEKVNGKWLSYTHGDMSNTVRRFARYIEKSGLKNTHIALFGRNSFKWSAAYFTVIAYSGVCFPIDRQYKARDLRNILSTAEISLFLYDKEKQEIIDQIKNEFSNIQFLSFEELYENSVEMSEDFLECDKKPEETSLIIFTSGTSSVPKAVMLSQKNLFANFPYLIKRTPMDETDRILLVIPISHVYAGVTALLYSAISGMQIFYGTPAVEICAKEFQEVKPTVFTSVPLLAQGFIKASRQMNISLMEFTGGHIKYFFSGGATVPAELKSTYLSENITFIDGYGISEASCVVALDIPHKYREGSTGVALDNIDFKIENPDENGHGEIIIKGENIMSGYYKNPDLTAEVMTENGYYRTGDMGYIDSDRYIYITGRKRRVIITSNGKNVFADELEEYFSAPSIIKVHIFAKENEIIMKCWYKGNLENVRQFITAKNKELPKFKKITSCEFTEDIDGGRIK